MPFLTLVATATGKSSRALEEQIVLTNIIYTLIFIEKELIQFFSLPFTYCFIIVQVYTLKIHLFGHVRCSSIKITTVAPVKAPPFCSRHVRKAENGY